MDSKQGKLGGGFISGGQEDGFGLQVDREEGGLIGASFRYIAKVVEL